MEPLQFDLLQLVGVTNVYLDIRLLNAPLLVLLVLMGITPEDARQKRRHVSPQTRRRRSLFRRLVTLPETEDDLERLLGVLVDPNAAKVHVGRVLALDAGTQSASAQSGRLAFRHPDDVEGHAVDQVSVQEKVVVRPFVALHSASGDDSLTQPVEIRLLKFTADVGVKLRIGQFLCRI